MKWGILITLPQDAIPEEALESLHEIVPEGCRLEITEVLE